MIKGINAQGSFITVSGGTVSSTYISPGSAGAGMLRWNPNMNCMEVNDGSVWKTLESSYASVSLTPEAESILLWARRKMEEDRMIESLQDDHPAVKIAKENLNKAKEAALRAEQQLKATVTLSKEHEQQN